MSTSINHFKQLICEPSLQLFILMSFIIKVEAKQKADFICSDTFIAFTNKKNKIPAFYHLIKQLTHFSDILSIKRGSFLKNI